MPLITPPRYFTTLVKNHLQKRKMSSLLKWVSVNFCENKFQSLKCPVWGAGSYSYYIPQNPRFYTSKTSTDAEIVHELDVVNLIKGGKWRKIYAAAQREAQAALLDYLHCTRSLQFMDAENMSRNTPIFLNKLLKKIDHEESDGGSEIMGGNTPNFLNSLLKKIDNEENVGRWVTRFLRYHPINEFEPFFESIGLKPCEYSGLLPRNLMFLNDDKKMLENYYVLCNYGIPRNNIGKIYKEAGEVFRYRNGILLSKLQAFEKVGLTQSFVIKIVASSPHVLICKANNIMLFRVIEKLKSIGFDYDWIEGQLLEKKAYNWGHILELLSLFDKIVCNRDKLRGVVTQIPGLIFNESGTKTFNIIGFLMKFGATRSDINSMLINIPQLEVGTYFCNLRQCYNFLVETEMNNQEIGKIMRTHPVLLGSCCLKKVNSLISSLNTGKKKICELIIENPEELRNWVLGSKVNRLPKRRGNILVMKKTEFLIRLGFIENSIELKKALKLFRGKAEELQERFECFIKAGLTQSDVTAMVKSAPQIINQRKEMIEMKIDFLVNDLGYPVSSLIVFPSYIAYTTERVNLRCSMYNWLVDEKTVEPDLALSTIIACSDSIFMKQYVNQHPNGLVVWEKLKKLIYSE